MQLPSKTLRKHPVDHPATRCTLFASVLQCNERAMHLGNTVGTIGASQCNVLRRIAAITKSAFKDHAIHGGNNLQTIRSLSAKGLP